MCSKTSKQKFLMDLNPPSTLSIIKPISLSHDCAISDLKPPLAQ